MKDYIVLNVNGKEYEFSIGRRLGQVPANETLVHTLRERLGLTGTKSACNQGACGCCAVLLDDKAVASCMTLTSECDGKRIVTIEGLQDPVTGEPDRVQKAFMKNSAFQCGFCTPGIIIAVESLLRNNPSPTEDDVKEALSGNYCRCISHYQVLESVRQVLEEVKA